MPNVGNSRTLLLGSENSDGTLTGVITGQSQPYHIPYDAARTYFLIGVGTINGGTILIEEADYPEKELIYTGTWSILQTISASTLTGNQTQAIHIMLTASAYVRVRISSTITGTGTFGVLATMRSPGQI